MATVMKKDGQQEPFDVEKIKNAIRAAATEAGLPEEKVSAVVEQVSGSAAQLAEGKEQISTTEIREHVLTTLDSVEPSVSEAWRKHDEGKVASQEPQVQE